MWRLLMFGFIVQSFTFYCKAQSYTDKRFAFSGYVKDLRSGFLFDGLENVQFENRIHNRLQLRYFATDRLTVGVDMRNQLIYGELVGNLNSLLGLTGASYSELLATDLGIVDLSHDFVINDRFFYLMQFDRAWVDYRFGKWQARLGRQRINWGQNFIWNPNDLFNAFNFLDFDYEERPGTDALQLQYFYNFSSRLEVVFAPQSNLKESRAAALWQFNRSGYDIQLIAGYYQHQGVLATGWAGSLFSVIGFKGEVSYFTPGFDGSDQRPTGVVASLGFDYATAQSYIFQLELLYNGFAERENSGSILDLSLAGNGGGLSPQTIWPYRYALAGSGIFPISARTSLIGAVIYNPTDHSVIAAPSASIQLSEAFDWLFQSQLFINSGTELPTLGRFDGTINTRLRWSF